LSEHPFACVGAGLRTIWQAGFPRFCQQNQRKSDECYSIRRLANAEMSAAQVAILSGGVSPLPMDVPVAPPPAPLLRRFQ
jgi:hypothetical protein